MPNISQLSPVRTNILGMNNFDIKKLREWFLGEQRDLPWRENPSPYRVWISEVMLQQTQVAVVIPYFERWMQLFPTIEKLANAPLDEVIKAWEGLGYYARARNLHSGAKQVIADFNGKLPGEENNLQKIKGLGPYTIGAIRAFAFKQKAAAVDGNVLRVLSRYDALEEDICKPKTVQKLRDRALQILPDEEPWVISEALIELGATICTKKPKCTQCPLNKSCQGLQQGKVHQLPIKSPKAPITTLYRAVAIIVSKGHYLVRRAGQGEIMSDLHEFPYFETDASGWTTTQFMDKLRELWEIEVRTVNKLEQVRHGFTRYTVRLNPVLFEMEKTPTLAGYHWISGAELEKLAFSSGHKRIHLLLKNK